MTDQEQREADAAWAEGRRDACLKYASDCRWALIGVDLAPAYDEQADVFARLATYARDCGWRTMESAPRDGTPLLLFARAKNATAPGILVGWHLEDDGWIELCFGPRNDPVGIVPFAWMPLPTFPMHTAGGINV